MNTKGTNESETGPVGMGGGRGGSGGAGGTGGTGEGAAPKARTDFIREIINRDLATGRYDGRVHTRFPPEPNGYLHIGHAKSICLNFGLAEQYGGKCNLRFDDTNPVKEEQEYVDSIINDVRWLGFDCTDRVLFASDYFPQMYDYAEQLILAGRAYVCDLTAEEVRRHRGTLTEPGRESPHRNRSIDENLDLFRRMRAGEFPDGSKTLRAKIDMSSPNLNLRDPVMYRILRAHHHRTGDDWCVYPMYDWAHGLEDSIERITHSICTLEFEDHRPLYDWFLESLGVYRPQQIEFARLSLNYTVMSKRKLLELVKGGYVRGWSDPRMPTLSGMRRRGYTPEAIRAFCERIGVSKFNSTIDIALLEHCVREHLNATAPRAMAVLNPLRLVLENYPEGQVEELDAINNPEDPSAGTRKVPFSRVLYIEGEDFMEDPPKQFFRLAPGREVRLRYAYFITCREAVKDDAGNVVELRCTYDPATRGGDAPDGRKVKATLHWVSAAHAVPAEVRLYEHLFTHPDPDEVDPAVLASGGSEQSRDPEGDQDGSLKGAVLPAGRDWKSNLNPNSLTVLRGCLVEPSLAAAPPAARFQFERQGYFCVDPDTLSSAVPDSAGPSGSAATPGSGAASDLAGPGAAPPGRLVFNRTVALKDTWAKVAKKGRDRGQESDRG
jgi:glutaminyl-tRNA synthetase